MRIGIVTDIHDEADKLRAALATLRADGADVLVSLGDVSDFHGENCSPAEVCGELSDAGVLGVWGNHDYGLCRDVPASLAARTDPDVLAYLATTEPRREIEGCSFTHVEPWLNPHDVADLWYFDGPPETAEALARSFRAVTHRVCFLGHFHRWLAATPRGTLAWRGETPLTLRADERFLVVVGPLFAGAFALYDTATCLLTPYRLP